MKRRKFITLASVSITTMAGCIGDGESSGNDPNFGDGEENISSNGSGSALSQPSTTGIVDARYDNTDLIVEVANPDEIDEILVESDGGQGTTINVDGTEVRRNILETSAATPDRRVLGPGEATLTGVDEEGETVDELRVVYEPNLELTVRPAVGSVYVPEGDEHASVLFTFFNSGTGPTSITSFEVKDGEETVSLTEPDDFGEDETTFVRTERVSSRNEEMFEEVGIDEDNEGLVIPERSSLTFGADGIFVHLGPEPVEIESFEQTFEVSVRTGLHREFVFEVSVDFRGGVVDSSYEPRFGTPTYRFEEFDIETKRIV